MIDLKRYQQKFDDGFGEKKQKVRKLLNQIKGGGYCCKIHKDVQSRSACRDQWFYGRCRFGVPEAKITRAYCQSVNFSQVTEVEPIGVNSILSSVRNVKKELIEVFKEDLKPKFSKEKKMPTRDRASTLLSGATSPKEVLKIMRARGDIDQVKIKNLSKQVTEKTATFGRVKMTALNLLRGAMKRKGGAKPVKKTVGKEAPKTAAKKKATSAPSRRRRISAQGIE